VHEDPQAALQEGERGGDQGEEATQDEVEPPVRRVWKRQRENDHTDGDEEEEDRDKDQIPGPDEPIGLLANQDQMGRLENGTTGPENRNPCFPRQRLHVPCPPKTPISCPHAEAPDRPEASNGPEDAYSASAWADSTRPITFPDGSVNMPIVTVSGMTVLGIKVLPPAASILERWAVMSGTSM